MAIFIIIYTSRYEYITVQFFKMIVTQSSSFLKMIILQSSYPI